VANTIIVLTQDGPTKPFLPAEALDGIADLLARAPDAGSRAAIVTALVGEIYDTADWLVDSPESQEFLSMGQVVAEAQAHQARMTGTDTRPASSGSFHHGNAALAGVPA
jgi:hypothetical protein